jgi:hypothetical protein
MLSNVGGRMHNEDLDGDIERCWTALRQTTLLQGSNNVLLSEVMNALRPILEATFGVIPEGYEKDAKVSSFIAGLFLTHKGIASITQGNEITDLIMIEDLWPQLSTFAEVIEASQQEDEVSQTSREEAKTGSVLHAERLQMRAEKAREAEEKQRLKKEKELLDEENKINQNLDWLVE